MSKFALRLIGSIVCFLLALASMYLGAWLFELTAHKHWSGFPNFAMSIFLTGGEPLLPGWQKAYPELIEEIFDRSLHSLDNFYLTIETNGTQRLIDPFFNCLLDINAHFSVSLKLRASGEPWEKTFNPDALSSYEDTDHYTDFKFVVDSESHVQEIANLFETALHSFRDWPVYLMPEGGTNEAYIKNKRKVADLALKYGYRFSPRLQCEISDNSWGHDARPI